MFTLKAFKILKSFNEGLVAKQGRLLVKEMFAVIIVIYSRTPIWLSIIESLIVCAKPNNSDEANNCSNNEQPTLGTSSKKLRIELKWMLQLIIECNQFQRVMEKGHCNNKC